MDYVDLRKSTEFYIKVIVNYLMETSVKYEAHCRFGDTN